MEWADQARGLVDTIDGALGLSEQGDVVHPAQVQQPDQNPPQVVVAPQRHEVMLPPISLPKFSDENYPRVVEILKKRFGDEKSIVETLQSELLHLPKPSDSVQSLRQFSESIERICQQLSDFGENEQNKFMASTIKSKLPYHLLTQVVEKEMRSGGTFDCFDLRKAITSIVEVKEEVQRCTQVFRGEEKPRNFPPQIQRNNFQGRETDFPPNQFRQGHWRPNNGRSNNVNDSVGIMSPQVDRSFLAMQKPPFSQRETGTRQTCSLCGAVGHPPSRCPQYSTSGTRRRRLAKQRKCFNCLLKGQKAQHCNSPKRCLKCSGKHHYMVCRYRGAPNASTQQTTDERRSVQKKQSLKQRGEPPRANKTNYSKIHLYSGVEDKPSAEVLASDGNSTNGLTNVTKKSHALSTMCRVVVKRRDHQKMIENPVVFDQACQTSSKSDSHIGEQNSPKLSSTEREFCGGKNNGKVFHSIFSIRIKRMDNKWEEILPNEAEQIALLCFGKNSDEIRKVELCCSENCYIHENVHKLTYELPKEILLNDYQCQVVDECVLIECYLCMEQLANPTCYPLVSSTLAGGLCLSLMSISFMAKSISPCQTNIKEKGGKGERLHTIGLHSVSSGQQHSLFLLLSLSTI
ncbi:hypothetical protein niasHT_006314 [Heterodera trifolii]|uniref:Uncharacterized protein n=1 Tax=Heterodera trifolii TaxID=157864 RepID=A0ABD2M0S5_9BILA